MEPVVGIPLRLLNAGEVGSIESICAQSHEMHRLEEMGLRFGAKVEMLQPGSPCIIRLDGAKICLRAEELSHVLVVPGVGP